MFKNEIKGIKRSIARHPLHIMYLFSTRSLLWEKILLRFYFVKFVQRNYKIIHNEKLKNNN